MARLTRTILTFTLWLVAALIAPLSAASGDALPLGEATLFVPQDWQITDQRRDVEVDLAGPVGQSLRAFWWFPDEPLLGYDDQISHETRSFPAGPALIIRSQVGGRSVVQAAFERENADHKRLLFLIESETDAIKALEATLEPFLQGLRFSPDQGLVTQAPPLPKSGDLPDDAAGNLSVQVPQLSMLAPGAEGGGADGQADQDPALRPIRFDQILAALNPVYGGDCSAVAVSGLPAFSVMNGASFAPGAAAICPASGVTIVAVTLPQDPRTGQSGPLGRAYLRVFLAQARAPLVLVDQAHGAVVALTAASGAGIAVAVSDLVAPFAAVGEPAPQAATPLFQGQMDAGWLPHAVRGGNFDDWARFEAGVLSVDVASPASTGTTGLKSAAPMVTLPAPGDGASVLVQFDFDTATTNNAVFALVPPDQVGTLDWDGHEIWAALVQKRDAAPELILAVQRQVQGRYTVTDRDVLTGLTLELQPDGLVLLSNAAGLVLVQGQMAAVPAARDLHLQVSASSPGANMSAHLDLRSIFLHRKPFDATNDPALIVAGEPHEVTLFDGRALGLHFDVHDAVGQDLTGKLSIADGLRIAAPTGDGLSGLGIYAPEPVVWLDRFTKGASARLRFEFDPAQTDGFLLALAVPYGKPYNEPGVPRFVLDWHRLADGSIKASRWIDRDRDRLDATPTAMPAVVELLLTAEGVQVLAAGFPDDVQPWAALQAGQGFRLYALATAETAAEPVAMVLNRITLLRTPGAEHPPLPQPMPGVGPLPVTGHFPNPAAPWEPYGLAGVDFAESGRFDADGGLVVDVAAKYELGRAGVLSPVPVAVLDERITQTPYRLTLQFDPQLTDGVEVMLSNTKTTDMWKGSELSFSLVRESTGRDVGSYRLTLTRDFYAYWTRRISAADMVRWDGALTLDLSPDVVVITLPGVVTHRGTGGFAGIVKGAAFHMVVQSLSDLKYGAARMALKSVHGQWVTPDRMTRLQRFVLLDPAAFDENEYLDALVDDLVEDGK